MRAGQQIFDLGAERPLKLFEQAASLRKARGGRFLERACAPEIAGGEVAVAREVIVGPSKVPGRGIGWIQEDGLVESVDAELRQRALAQGGDSALLDASGRIGVGGLG